MLDGRDGPGEEGNITISADEEKGSEEKLWVHGENTGVCSYEGEEHQERCVIRQ